MTNADRRPRPRAFRLDGDTVIPPKTQQQAQPFTAEVVEPKKDPFASETFSPDAEERAVEAAQIDGVLQRFLLSWGGVFWTALGGLASLALTMWVTGLVENLFAHSSLLGTIGLALAVALALAAVFLLARELRAMMRQNRIARLHIALAQARNEDDGKAARARLVELCKIYENRVETAKARARVLELSKEIIDGRDLIDLAERTLVLPLDQRVTREIAAASKRVSVVTTVSPRALLDVIFVAGQAIWLMRRIAEIYGGRPGLLGFFKLARSVGAHLTITGGLAIGDSLLQQLVGHGIAAKLSARLGEGVLNGLLTARVGLSAMAVCRPMPFGAEKQPGVKEVAPFLFGDRSK
ncbi:MAG TPA: TIGR01620 family protein [Methylocystis sp.]|nr:TIGR01620 family protein [Methylocystis sp.]